MSVHNGLPYLGPAVESILNQTFKNFEFIIVDDASEDKTWHYLKSLKDKRVKLIKNPKNLGLAKSLNIALSKAKGEYIARMDADDISVQKRFATQIKFMIDNPAIDICGSQAMLIDENGKKVFQVRKPIADNEIKKEIDWLTPLIHPTWFAKRKVYELLGGYDPKWDIVEDYEFLIRARKFKMANIDESLLLWRRQSNRRSQKEIQKMYKKGLQMRWHFLKKGRLPITYVPYLIRSFITAYFFPTELKIYLSKKSKLG